MKYPNRGSFGSLPLFAQGPVAEDDSICEMNIGDRTLRKQVGYGWMMAL